MLSLPVLSAPLGVTKYHIIQYNSIMAIGKSVVIKTIAPLHNSVHFSHELYIYINTFDILYKSSFVLNFVERLNVLVAVPQSQVRSIFPAW